MASAQREQRERFPYGEARGERDRRAGVVDSATFGSLIAPYSGRASLRPGIFRVLLLKGLQESLAHVGEVPSELGPRAGQIALGGLLRQTLMAMVVLDPLAEQVAPDAAPQVVDEADEHGVVLGVI